MKKILFASIGLVLAFSGMAQENEPEFIERNFQLSFISPLGTNGMESGRCINKLSLNLYLGYAAGVNGTELGGFANIITHDMNGAQLAGFLNYVGGNTEGFQAAGFANLNGDSVEGTQLAGFTNLTNGVVSGTQVAGFTNLSRKVEGTQLAGFMNIAQETQGAQIAGFLNYTGRLKGFQLAVINVVDSVEEGTPVSVFTIVRNGYNHWEVFMGETMQANLAFKFGSSRFYNTLAVGAGFEPFGEKSMLGFGYGIGRTFALGKNQLSLDAIAYQLLEMQQPFATEDNGFNQLAQLKLSYDFVVKQMSYFVGPTFNVLTQQSQQYANEGWHPYAPYSFYENTTGKRRVNMWLGLQAGIRF